MEEPVAFGEFDRGAKEGGEGGGGEKVLAVAVGGDAAVAHEEDTLDFGDDVGGVVGDEEDGGSVLCEVSEELAEIVLRGNIEGVGRLVEEEHVLVQGLCVR